MIPLPSIDQNAKHIHIAKSASYPAIDLSIYKQRAQRHAIWMSTRTKITVTSDSIPRAIEATGYATRITLRKSLLISFYEAWERAALFLYPHSKEPQAWPEPRTSNGIASGRNEEDAAHRAVAELFERHCLLTVWNHESGARRVAPPLWGALGDAFDPGWSFECYEIGRAPGLFVACTIARHAHFGARFDSAAKPSLREAVWHSYVNTCKDAAMKTTEQTVTKEDWHRGYPLSHLGYYSDPQNNVAFNFLQMADSRPVLILSQVTPTLMLLWEGGGMPTVVRAIDNQMKSPLWGVESIRVCPKNPHPHPLY
jgi:hypothetical protein